ncbi:MAG: T9SS type A sorting domain-containing protein [Bacteroidetes bacterium]|nr:T9SS type A sorting domain-containing protein [Bacteroidota bacterium]
MKKTYSSLLMLLSLLVCGSLSAQYCGSSSSAECTPAGTMTQSGFMHPDSLACVVQGQAYDESIQFKMYDLFDVVGSQAQVDSIEFLKLDSLPCGLCWSTNKSNNRFSANEFGCIRIKGTSNDAAGQYKFNINLKAWINNTPTGIPVAANMVDDAGIKLFIRVKTPAGACNPVDTSSSAHNLSTNPTNCATGVNNLSETISSITLVPNPVNSKSVLSFTSLKGGNYTLRITDLTGKIMSQRAIETNAGSHQETILRNGLPAGIYFLSLSDGTSSVTKRFAVAE